MGFLDNLKTLVTKGPSGLTQVMMKDQLDWSDRFNNADKTDPVVMNALMEEQRQTMTATLDKHPLASAFMPPDTRDRINAIFKDAGTNSAAMHQLLEAQKAKMAAEAQPAPSPPKE